jgi:hypothetical protein
MKRSIQTSVLAILVLVTGCVAANAQTSYGAKVRVPFSFNIGARSYEPGEYIIKVDQAVFGASKLVIQGSGLDRSQSVLLTGTSAGGSESEQKLIFGEDNGQRYLAGITTITNSYSLVDRPKNANLIVKISNTSIQKTKM